jgi:hypothetical protein
MLKILVVALFLNLSVPAQQTRPGAGWDFTYTSVLERNNVAESDWIWRWVRNYRSPAEEWITGWEGKPVVSSVLIEYPAFHAGEHTTMLFIRTNDEAFYWELVEGKRKNEEPISPQLYDAFFEQASTWQQLQPKTARELPEQALPGYFGFLSYSSAAGSKQMLLTMDDFFICLDKSCLPGKMRSGRLMRALEPILIPESKKNYRHKSEAEIAKMSPEQRIDELIREQDHLFDGSDRQSDLIQKYRQRDGLKGAAHLIHLIDSYDPKRLSDTRYFNAIMTAADIDDNLVRLRASPDGRRLIDAIDRVSGRMLAAGEQTDGVLTTLGRMRGINSADEALRDTLWVRYRIKMWDAQLLAFSRYLTANDPTYPRWSGRRFIKDLSRINEAGNPLQVFVMTDPRRYHEAYLSFRKQARVTKRR